MDCDVLIIGAGLSGLAAGVRLAHFGRRVCIAERHHTPGGLNSYFERRGRLLDVGLHAFTNFSGPAARHAPLNRLLRQLRLAREDFDLCPQTVSLLEMPSARLRFTNDIRDLEAGVARAFPHEAEGFRGLLEAVRAWDNAALGQRPESAREALARFLRDPVLRDLLLQAMMFYGNPAEHDMDFGQFRMLFQSVFLEGIGRPRGGMRTVIEALLERYRQGGGELRCGCAVSRLEHDGARVLAATLEDGTRLRPGAVLSCAGLPETLALCDPPLPEASAALAGSLGFVETVLLLDRPPRLLGLDFCVAFTCSTPEFRYECPPGLADLRSAVICCPGNYAGCEGGYADGQVRLTHLANPAAWFSLEGTAYREAKRTLVRQQLALLERRAPGIAGAVQDWDLFTPRTIRRFTGRLNGAIYGSPSKRYDGTTSLANLFLCGTDQGLVGIVGAMLSGVAAANAHLLR